MNEVTFGFDKPELIEDWLTKIKKIAKKDEELTSTVLVTEESIHSESKTNHNMLNIQVEAKIEKINVKVYLTESLSKDIIYFEIGGIYS